MTMRDLRMTGEGGGEWGWWSWEEGRARGRDLRVQFSARALTRLSSSTMSQSGGLCLLDKPNKLANNNIKWKLLARAS